MKSKFTIGKVLKPRGLKGEIKFETYSSNSARFSRLKKLSIDEVDYSIEKISMEGAFGYVKLKGIDTIEQAELLRNKPILAKRDDLPPLEEGRYYVADMLGIDVVVGGRVVGEIVDILQYGSADVYVVKSGETKFSFPALKQLIKSVDIARGEIVLDDMMFDRVVVYN